MTALPDLPVEEEGRLHDPGLRENFVERVFAYGGSATASPGDGPSGRSCASTRRTSCSCSRTRATGYTALGRLVADAEGATAPELAPDYRATLHDHAAQDWRRRAGTPT